VTELLFIDTETVALHPFAGSVWEIAWMRYGDDEPTSHLIAPSLMLADPASLEINGFFDRFEQHLTTPADDVIGDLILALDDRPALAGSNPGFDEAHLLANWPELRGLWHHHPVDVPTLIAGSSYDDDPPPPWRLSQAARWAGIDPDAYDRHTAAGDVLLTRDLYRAWKTGAIAEAS
jgi:hypothetical protein